SADGRGSPRIARTRDATAALIAELRVVGVRGAAGLAVHGSAAYPPTPRRLAFSIESAADLLPMAVFSRARTRWGPQTPCVRVGTAERGKCRSRPLGSRPSPNAVFFARLGDFSDPLLVEWALDDAARSQPGSVREGPRAREVPHRSLARYGRLRARLPRA